MIESNQLSICEFMLKAWTLTTKAGNISAGRS